MSAIFGKPEKVIAYLTECTLATIGTMLTKKRIPKYEFERQVNIAQKGIDAAMQFPLESIAGYGRVDDVIKIFDCSVKDWAHNKREF